jgi:polyisoprenoid-binding protein YceI
MDAIMPATAQSGESSRLRRSWLKDLAGAAALAAGLSLTVALFADPGAMYLATALALLVAGTAGLALLAPRALARHHPHDTLGSANRVTLLRAAGLAPLAALAVGAAEPALAWFAVTLATALAVLDGVDGRLARRTGLSSAFGARFDMETDALLILVLSVLVWAWGKAGAWVLLSGVLRYAFVAAAAVWAWLGGALPSSRRRQTVCVLQVVCLILPLVPSMPPEAGAGVAGFGLAALVGSFLVDVRWLRAHRTPAGGLAAALACLWLGSAAAPALAAPARYEIDPSHLSIGFLVDHVGYAKTLGMFRKASGSYAFDEATGALTDVRIVIETASVFTNDEARDGHLRGKDFLDSQRHPSMVFTATKARRVAERRFVIDGQLQLLGRQRPVSLEATWNKSAVTPIGVPLLRPYVMGVSARGRFRRSEFGMNYAVDNGWVGDEVELIIEFEAKRR